MASGAFFPGVVPWSFFNGEYTLSSDRETISASDEEIRSGWIFADGAVAQVLWTLTSGTFDNVKMRSSAALPTDNSDRVLITPTTWDATYYPALGTKPTSQGWSNLTGGVGFTDNVSNGQLRLTTTTHFSYYRQSMAGLVSSSDNFGILLAKITLVTGHANRQAINWNLPHGSGTNNSLQIQFKGTAFVAAEQYKIYDAYGVMTFVDFALTPDVPYHIAIVYWANDGVVQDTRLLYRPAAGYDLTDMSDFVLIGSLNRSDVSSATNNVLWGNSIANNTSDIIWGDVLVFSGPEWETVTNGQVLFSALNRGYVQLKGTLSGVLTELDIQNDLTAPNNPSDPEIRNIGDDGISIYVPSSVSDAAAYEFKLRDSSDNLIDSEIVWNKGWTFSSVPDGTYYGEIYACSDDGVRSVSGAITDTITIPETLPVIDLDITESEVGAGETSSLTYTIPDTVTATLNNAAISGSGSEVVVTGSSSTTTPPNQPTSINVISAPDRPTYLSVLS